VNQSTVTYQISSGFCVSKIIHICLFLTELGYSRKNRVAFSKTQCTSCLTARLVTQQYPCEPLYRVYLLTYLLRNLHPIFFRKKSKIIMMFGTHNPEKNTQTILSLSIIRTKCHVPREMQNSSIWSRLHYCLQKVVGSPLFILDN